MDNQQGFTLTELMIVIAIIAILSAIGLPAYQNYLQKAAITDMLQLMMPYKTAIELCAMERGSVENCHAETYGIPGEKGSRYAEKVKISHGQITLNGLETLKGLRVELYPQWDPKKGELQWYKKCQSENRLLLNNCQSQFRFSDQQEEL